MTRYPQTPWQRSDDRHSTTAQGRAARNDNAERVRAPLAARDRALAGADRALALFLHVATVCFVLFALVLIAESL
jgi:hypothetical protein